MLPLEASIAIIRMIIKKQHPKLRRIVEIFGVCLSKGLGTFLEVNTGQIDGKQNLYTTQVKQLMRFGENFYSFMSFFLSFSLTT